MPQDSSHHVSQPGDIMRAVFLAAAVTGGFFALSRVKIENPGVKSITATPQSLPDGQAPR